MKINSIWKILINLISQKVNGEIKREQNDWKYFHNIKLRIFLIKVLLKEVK